MKKEKNTKLSFKKETISVLNNNSMVNINGGGFLSILGTSCQRKKCGPPTIVRDSEGPTTCPMV